MKKHFLLHLIILFLCVKQITILGAGLLSQPELAINKARENIQKYMDFEQDYLDFAQKSRSSDADYFHNISEIEANISDLTEERAFVNGLQIAEHTVDLMLRRFLERRLRTLALRHDLFRTERYLDDDSERMRQKDASQVTMCQFYDQLIVEIYQLSSLANLSARTCFLIRMSPIIWPLLRRETQELPHPDLAIYGVLGDKSRIRPNSDLGLYKTYEERRPYLVRMMGLGGPRDATVVIELTPYEKSYIDRGDNGDMSIRELSYPDWLKIPIPQLRVDRAAPSTSKKRKGKGHCHLVQKSLSEKAADTADGQGMEDEKADASGDKMDVEADASGAQGMEGVKPDTSGTQGMEDVEEDSGAQGMEGVKPDASTQGMEDVEHKKVESTTTTKKAAPPLPPRGMRVFHPHTQIFRTNFKTLSGSHNDTLETLMDKRHFTPITYAAFASLWRAINGQDSIRESTGSSHKALLDADGRIVTGIFAHSGNMEYTRRTVPYLRYAVELLNISVN